ncbi:citrate lyase subunit alpha [Shigella flexneri]
MNWGSKAHWSIVRRGGTERAGNHPQFNVNVLTGSTAYLRGASGGHCDTATASRFPSSSRRRYVVVFRLGG